MAGARRDLDDGERETLFDARRAVARIDTVRMGLENGGPRSSHLSTRASGVRTRLHRTHASGWPILRLRRGSRARSLTGVIDIDDEDMGAVSVEPSIRRLLFRERPRGQVGEQECAQDVSGALVEEGEKATAHRTSRRQSRPTSARNESAHGLICSSDASRSVRH
jgi:hypothetical protein